MNSLLHAYPKEILNRLDCLTRLFSEKGSWKYRQSRQRRHVIELRVADLQHLHKMLENRKNANDYYAGGASFPDVLV
jgi:hypothetical protein